MVVSCGQECLLVREWLCLRQTDLLRLMLASAEQLGQ